MAKKKDKPKHEDEKTGKPPKHEKKLKKREYEKELHGLQVELVKLQEWVEATGARIVVVFEGRDAAGKGGTIQAITDRVSPRIFRTVALPKPNDRERTQFYFQRYMAHLPAAGEVVLFDRSWYNRAGVERVMGFCTEAEVEEFFRVCPVFENALVRSGIQLIKYWLSVGPEHQAERFQERIDDPRKHWKLSPMDLEARRRWYDYSRARDAMLAITDTDEAPWYLVDYTDQKRGRLNLITHLLSQIPYEDLPWETVELPERDTAEAYDDRAAVAGRTWVPERW
jgi:polyphosphate kinase 2